MEYEEDDDVLFAKWMSSYWGHSGIEGRERDARANKKRPPRALIERRASLPCPAQLSAMHMTRLHTASKAASPVNQNVCKEIREDTDLRVNRQAMPRKMSSPDETIRATKPPKKRSNSIQELSEYFERQLRFRSRKSTSLAQLSAVHMTRLQTASKAASPANQNVCKEIREDTDLKVNGQAMLHKMSSPDESLQATKPPKKRSNSIQELSEYFERQLWFRSRKSTSLVGNLKNKPVVDP